MATGKEIITVTTMGAMLRDQPEIMEEYAPDRIILKLFR